MKYDYELDNQEIEIIKEALQKWNIDLGNWLPKWIHTSMFDYKRNNNEYINTSYIIDMAKSVLTKSEFKSFNKSVNKYALEFRLKSSFAKKDVQYSIEIEGVDMVKYKHEKVVINEFVNQVIGRLLIVRQTVRIQCRKLWASYRKENNYE